MRHHRGAVRPAHPFVDVTPDACLPRWHEPPCGVLNGWFDHTNGGRAAGASAGTVHGRAAAFRVLRSALHDTALAPDPRGDVCWGMNRPSVRTEMSATGSHVVLAFAVSRRERVLVSAFWLLYGIVSVANRLFGGRRSPDGPSDMAFVLIAVAESVAWALLTPLLFNEVARRTIRDEARDALGRHVLWGLVAGVAIAGAMSGYGYLLRAELFPPRRSGDGPPIWFAFTNNAVLYGAVVAAALARAYSLQSRWRERLAVGLEAELAHATLATLRQQLDPHFLFNTLNLISSLVERDPKGVRRMIARLSELLRASLETGSRPEIPLRQELALLDAYLDIMRMRFGDRLTVEVAVEPGVLDTRVPTFLLQPLAENAMRHGIEPLRGAGQVQIVGERRGDRVVLQVRDNGQPSQSLDTRSGIGLTNTEARLRQLYGPAASFSLRREADRTVAEVVLPSSSAA